MQRTGMDPVDQQVQVQTDATDWDGSGSTSSSSTRCNDWDGLGWIRFINKFKFKQMQRTGMYPVDQQVQVQTDATDWDATKYPVDQQVQVQTDATDSSTS